MSSRSGANWLASAVVFLLSIPALAEPPAQSVSDADDRVPFESLAREAQRITDAVLSHHIDPPTRQEMWLAGTKALLANAGVEHSGGVSAEISRLTTAEQFAAFLKHLWAKEVVIPGHRSTHVKTQSFVDGMLGIIPGGATFISPKELAVQEQIQGNRYIGTGIALSFDEEQKYPRIQSVIPGGPMERAGGRDGDLILKIDDRDAQNLSIGELTDLLRGPEGTSVTLVVGAARDESRTIVVTRGRVVLPTLHGLRKDDAGQWDYRVEPWLPICCVKVLQINGSTVHDLRKLELQFRKDEVQAVILDLRSSFSQDLHHTLLLADALLDGGLIGRVRTGANVREYQADRECLFRDWPLAVLVNRHTQGGAEWIAAALQDNHAAIVIGEETAGIAVVQTSVLLPDNAGAVQMNTGIFERPSGRSLPNRIRANPARIKRDTTRGEAERSARGVIPVLP